MDFYEVFVRAPVNGSAASLLSASSRIEEEISREDLIFLIQRLHRKRRLLNRAIGIKTKAQRKNLMYKINNGKRTQREKASSRGVDEWRRNGFAIARLTTELARRNRKCTHTTARNKQS